MTTPDLKPCPFCGGEARLDECYNDCFLCMWSVFCRDCGATVNSIAGAERAVAVWNRRVACKEPCRKPEDCRYYTANSFWGGGCLGTKEIDPCKGADCENWRPKEASNEQDA